MREKNFNVLRLPLVAISILLTLGFKYFKISNRYLLEQGSDILPQKLTLLRLNVVKNSSSNIFLMSVSVNCLLSKEGTFLSSPFSMYCLPHIEHIALQIFDNSM